MKKGEIVKQERNQLIKVWNEQRSRITLKELSTYSNDFPHLNQVVVLDQIVTPFMFCKICDDKKDLWQAFLLARPNNR